VVICSFVWVLFLRAAEDCLDELSGRGELLELEAGIIEGAASDGGDELVAESFEDV